MLIDLSKLFEKEQTKLETSCPLETERVSFGSDTFDFVNKSPVELIINHSEKGHFHVTGKAEFGLIMFCARCLEAVTVPFNLELDTEFDISKNTDSSDELPYVRGYSLDVDLLVQDELFVNMPISVLCREDCKGLCRECGKNLNKGSCSCDTTVPDPRMAKILDIFNANNKEV